MPRYIDADKALEIARTKDAYEFHIGDYQDFKEVIEDTPTADVQEVRHGKWIGYPSITISKTRRTIQSIIYKCSCCGKSNGRTKSPYCKNCGSKMYGEEAEAKLKELEEKK